MRETIERIGNVVVKSIQAGKQNAPVYSDGAPEDRLYMKFKKDSNYGANRQDTKFSSWAEEYHLSPVRHNLLKWFPFDSGGTVLEVGAGCGALTGLLCQKTAKVTALEYSRQRALITAIRHSQCSNLEVIVGGLQDFVSDEKFDYITVIGVLEYAGKFYGGEKPYKSFLARLRGMLKNNGVLILAIENKIGLKYICGAQEDHTGRIFDSLYDYPYDQEVQTFSKKELTGILQDAGFLNLEWYYPLPDYKMPQEVISEEITPGKTDSVWRLFPAKTGGRRRREIISEKRLGKTLTYAGLFGEFANSFLVIARAEDISRQSRCVRFIGANMARKSELKTNKQIYRNGSEKMFVLSADDDEGIGFIQKVAGREALAKKYFDGYAEVVTGKIEGNNLIYPYVPFPTIVELMAEAIANGDLKFGRFWIDEYLRFLLKLPVKRCIPQEFFRQMGVLDNQNNEALSCFSLGIIDCVPHNILFDKGGGRYCVIDNEFTYDFPIPVDFLIWRAINTLVVDLQSQIQSNVREDRPVTVYSGHGINREYIPVAWVDVLSNLKIPVKQQARWSAAFENGILRHKINVRYRLKSKPKAIGRVSIAEINVKENITDMIYKYLRKVKRLL
jgi:2-polyprenyl-3-methyl-5-hydroxy-6-metoxy-1,4-benzoquinol methylase